MKLGEVLALKEESMERDKRFGGEHKTRAYSIKKVWNRHHEMKRLLLLGHSNIEIAQILGVTQQNVSDVRNSPMFKREMEVLQAARDAGTVEIAVRLAKDAHKSLQLLEEVRDGRHDAALRERMRAATELLNRTPETANVTKQQTHMVNTSLSFEELEEIKRRARENAMAFQKQRQEAAREVAVEEEKVA